MVESSDGRYVSCLFKGKKEKRDCGGGKGRGPPLEKRKLKPSGEKTISKKEGGPTLLREKSRKMRAAKKKEGECSACHVKATFSSFYWKRGEKRSFPEGGGTGTL